MTPVPAAAQEIQKMLYEQDVTGRPMPRRRGPHRAEQATSQVLGAPRRSGEAARTPDHRLNR